MADGVKAHPPYAAGIDPSHAGDAVGYMLNGGLNNQRAKQMLEDYRARYPEFLRSADQIMAREQAASRLHRPVPEIVSARVEVSKSDIEEALARQRAKQNWTYNAPKEKVLADFSNAALVMEMISRGYAVMKLPADGGPPEVLR